MIGCVVDSLELRRILFRRLQLFDIFDLFFSDKLFIEVMAHSKKVFLFKLGLVRTDVLTFLLFRDRFRV